MADAVKKFRKNKHSLDVKQRRFGYLFTLPFLIGVVLFILIPIGQAIVYSLCDLDNNEEGMIFNFIGLGNYKHIWLEVTDFRKLVLDSLIKMVTNVPVVVIFSFFMASVLNTKFHGRTLARSIMFLPVIISTGIILSLASGDMTSSLLDAGDRFSATAGETFQVTSAFEMLLEQMDISQWLIDFIMNAVDSISTIVSWSAVSIIIFIAGLQSISPSIYEASYIEGATKWEVFWKISLPMVSPLILTSVVYTIVDAFNGTSSSVISKIHSTMLGTDYDIASAMAICYSLIILLVLVIVFAVLNKVIFYQD